MLMANTPEMQAKLLDQRERESATSGAQIARTAAQYVGAGLGFFAMAYLAIELTRGDGRVAMVWIPNAVAVATIYGFWTHTETVGKLWRPLEWFFVTPSHHRAHHGSNPEYIDKNYANLLIIWDRLFATFEPEIAPVRYGLINNIHTYNPLKIAFTEWYKLLRDTVNAGSIERLRQVWTKPPGWKPEHAEVAVT